METEVVLARNELDKMSRQYENLEEEVAVSMRNELEKSSSSKVTMEDNNSAPKRHVGEDVDSMISKETKKNKQ